MRAFAPGRQAGASRESWHIQSVNSEGKEAGGGCIKVSPCHRNLREFLHLLMISENQNYLAEVIWGQHELFLVGKIYLRNQMKFRRLHEKYGSWTNQTGCFKGLFFSSHGRLMRPLSTTGTHGTIWAMKDLFSSWRGKASAGEILEIFHSWPTSLLSLVLTTIAKM